MTDQMSAGRVADQVAVVTGAASGLGLACAQLLAAEGAAVVVADIDEAAAHRAAASLGRPAWAQVTDVAVESSVAALFDAVRCRSGRLDILVTCAALTDPEHQAGDQAIADLDVHTWERT